LVVEVAGIEPVPSMITSRVQSLNFHCHREAGGADRDARLLKCGTVISAG
jgi:hypothetical protein